MPESTDEQRIVKPFGGYPCPSHFSFDRNFRQQSDSHHDQVQGIHKNMKEASKAFTRATHKKWFSNLKSTNREIMGN